MKNIKNNQGTRLAIALICIFFAPVFQGCEKSADHHEKKQKGYILKPREGEILFEDIANGLSILKASPETGTRGSIMIYDEMSTNSTSGIHYHVESDELFYVLEGNGKMLVGDMEENIGPGDFVFVPAGEDHRITSGTEDQLRVVYFMEKPGLAYQFREEARLELDRKKITVEEFNKIVEKYGSVYKTFD